MVVSNALGVRLTGNKSTDKSYFHHSGFMGGLKEVPITRMRDRKPEEVSCVELGWDELAVCSACRASAHLRSLHSSRAHT